jgi:FkbM family methyltransferase
MLKPLRSKLYSLRSLQRIYGNWLGILRVYFFGGESTASLDNLRGGKLHFRVSKSNIERIISLSNVLVKFEDLGYEVRNDKTMRRIMRTLTPYFTKEELCLLGALGALSDYITAVGKFDENYDVVTDINEVKWLVRKASPKSMWGDVLFGPLLRYYQEPEEYRWLLSAIKAGGVFVDVGANVGGFSVRASKMGAIVIAIEPSPDNYNVLKSNLELNQCLKSKALNIAAGSKEETRNLYGDDSTVGCTLKQGEGKQIKCSVKVRPLDVALWPLLDDKRVDLLKVDVEGLEVEVLKGAEDLLMRTRHVIVEVIPSTESKMLEVLNVLKPLGFELIDKVCRESLYCDLFLRKSQ